MNYYNLIRDILEKKSIPFISTRNIVHFARVYFFKEDSALIIKFTKLLAKKTSYEEIEATFIYYHLCELLSKKFYQALQTCLKKYDSNKREIEMLVEHYSDELTFLRKHYIITEMEYKDILGNGFKNKIRERLVFKPDITRTKSSPAASNFNYLDEADNIFLGSYSKACAFSTSRLQNQAYLFNLFRYDRLFLLGILSACHYHIKNEDLFCLTEFMIMDKEKKYARHQELLLDKPKIKKDNCF